MANDDRDDPAWEAVGQAEPCDWCGRPGTVEQFQVWTDGTLDYRNPALCKVCSFWWNQNGDVIDAIVDAGRDYDAEMQPFEDELCRKWREKVARGTRSPQGPSERSAFVVVRRVTGRRVEKDSTTGLSKRRSTSREPPRPP